MRLLALARMLVVIACVVPATVRPARGDVGDATAVADLIRQLGADDYAVREAAAGRLTALGADAADALLAAAESSDDLEVAHRWVLVTASASAG